MRYVDSDTQSDAEQTPVRIVLDCTVALQACKTESKRKRDRVRLYLKRGELAKSIKDCSFRMAKAVQRFNVRFNQEHDWQMPSLPSCRQTTLQVEQVILLEDIKLVVHELRDVRSSDAPQSSVPIISYVLVTVHSDLLDTDAL